MVTGVGTDVVDIARFRALKERAEFFEQVFTPTEILRAPEGPSQDTFYASLFAMKEALLKALGCGLERGTLWRDIHITPDGRAHLSGALGQLAGEKSVSRIHVSHAFSKTSAVAFVLIETINDEVIV
jgi:holo-[acyl-carrier protein] synthase